VKKIIGSITILAGLTGLAGIYLLYRLGKNLPEAAVFVVVNSILLRGVCGTAGGVLLWMGKRWGSYLTALAWTYLIVVSVLTLISLFNRGLVLSPGFLSAHYDSFGKPLGWSLIKLLLGLPIVYLLIRDLYQSGTLGKNASRP
jgi:ABC-type polysaccharide/polyol phosphate export permease